MITAAGSEPSSEPAVFFLVCLVPIAINAAVGHEIEVSLVR